jgi:hypothetical protein
MKFWSENLKGNGLSEELEMEGKTTFGWIIRKQGRWCGQNSSGSEHSKTAGS